MQRGRIAKRGREVVLLDITHNAYAVVECGMGVPHSVGIDQFET